MQYLLNVGNIKLMDKIHSHPDMTFWSKSALTNHVGTFLRTLNLFICRWIDLEHMKNPKRDPVLQKIETTPNESKMEDFSESLSKDRVSTLASGEMNRASSNSEDKESLSGLLSEEKPGESAKEAGGVSSASTHQLDSGSNTKKSTGESTNRPEVKNLVSPSKNRQND